MLSPGAEINDKNEVVDYVEVSQDAEGKYIVPRAFAYNADGSDFESTDSASFIASLNDSQYTPEIDSNIISNIELNDIKTKQEYKIIYSIEYKDENKDTKFVSAVRNVIVRDTTAPEITINKKEDVILYYKADDKINVVSYKFPINNIVITDNSGNENGVNYTVKCDESYDLSILENTEVSMEKNVKIDLTRPTMTVTQTPTPSTSTSTDKYLKSVVVNIKAEASISQLSSSNNYQYCLSTSSSSLSGCSWKSYTNGSNFTLGTNLTGTYYLIFKRVSDNAKLSSYLPVSGNNNKISNIMNNTRIDNVVYHVLGSYKFDNTGPTVTLAITQTPTPSTSTNNYTKSLKVKITVADNASGVPSSNTESNKPYRYYLSTSSTNLTGGNWVDYTNGTEFTIGSPKSGTYYLFVKKVNDNLGNVSTATGSTDTTITSASVTHHRFGLYKLDNTNPQIAYSSEKVEHEHTVRFKLAYVQKTKISGVITEGNGYNDCNSTKCTSSSVSFQGVIYFNGIKITEDGTDRQVIWDRYYAVKSQDVVETFKSSKALSRVYILPKHSGNSSCYVFKYSVFSLDGVSYNLNGRTNDGTNDCLSASSISNDTTSSVSTVYSCVGKYNTSACMNTNINNVYAIVSSGSYDRKSKLTVSYLHSGGVQVSTNNSSFSSNTEISCTAVSGSTCNVYVKDAVGNTRTVTCTNSTGTCS